MFLGDYHALIEFVRSLDKQPKNNGDYVVITVLDEQPTSKLKHFLKSEFTLSDIYSVSVYRFTCSMELISTTMNNYMLF